MSNSKKDDEHKGKQKPKQRLRPTNKSVEAQRFSTVKLPKQNEVPAASRIHSAPDTQGTAFDPIPSDGMFTIVENSKFWPPPPLDSLKSANGMENGAESSGLTADGMDSYDRRADDAAAKKEKLKIVKKLGEVSHPRGRPQKNVKVAFDDD